MISVSRCSSVALIALLLAGGCSQGVSIKTVPVSGKVTLDDQPLSGANVTFVPAAQDSSGLAQPASTGVTGADGSYKLVTMAGSKVVDGAPPGSYKVIVTKNPNAGAVATDPMDAMSGLSDEERAKKMQSMSPEELAKMSGSPPKPEDQSGAPKSEVPERYGKADESGLTATVAASGAQTFDLPLTSK